MSRNNKEKKTICESATIETDRIILRKFTKHDDEDMFNNYIYDPRVAKFMTWEAHQSIKETRQKIKRVLKAYKKTTQYIWCIIHKELGQVIGEISYARGYDTGAYGTVPKITYLVGFVLSADYWGQGIMPEVLSATNDYLLNSQYVERIVGGHLQTNVNSGKVMLKAGMQYLFSEDDESNRNYVKDTNNITDLVYKIEKQE